MRKLVVLTVVLAALASSAIAGPRGAPMPMSQPFRGNSVPAPIPFPVRLPPAAAKALSVDIAAFEAERQASIARIAAREANRCAVETGSHIKTCD